ncbi:PIG-L deacetylase family protein [Rhodococcus sp. X156]|uniref:PIG-L deacetylase family protein n=1 Tax=Rhodococcus sp. X156 TaxID=2499145 RepID=UPI0019D01C41|nr:PIG-L deacetylase family protein [Rhodococcus sp. X156]
MSAANRGMVDLPEMPLDWHRALAIAAHPDDLEYGAAGAVATWVQAGKEVVYLLVTRGEAGMDSLDPEVTGPLREAEQRAAAAQVGVHTVEFLEGYSDGVVEYGIALRHDLAARIRHYQPDLVLTGSHRDTWPSGGWNFADHRAVGLATMDAVADAGNRWIFRDAGEPWSPRLVAVVGSPRPTHCLDVSATTELAVASLAEHRAYLAELGLDARGVLAQVMPNPNVAAFEIFGA